MRTITVGKAELAEILLANHDAHHAIFEEAIEGYRRKALELLEAHIEAIRAGKAPVVRVYLDRPVDHTRDYQRVLAMLAMHVGDTIELSEQHFAHYVQDDWEWKRQFLATSSNYSATAAQLVKDEDE